MFKKPLLIVTKTLIYTGAFWLIHQLLNLFLPDLPVPVSFFITMLVIVPNRGKLTAMLQKFIEKSLYRSQYDLTLLILKYRQELNESLDYYTVLDDTHRFLSELLRRENYELFLYTDHLFEKHTPAEEKNQADSPLEFPIHDGNFALFRAPLRFYPLKRMRDEQPHMQPLLQHFRETRFSYFVPLNGAAGPVGFLLFTDILRQRLALPDFEELLIQTFVKTTLFLEQTRAHLEIKRKSLESELLLDIVRKINSTLNLQSVLDNLMDNISRLVPCDAAAIFLVDREKEVLIHMVTRGYDSASIGSLSLKLNEGLSGKAIREKRGFITPDVSADPAYRAGNPTTRSQLTVPIIIRDDALGALVLESNVAQFFTHQHLQLLTFASGLTAIAIRNAQLFEDSLRKQQLESDLLVASTVQKALLPVRVPTIKGLKIHAFSLPNQIVGGDIYDVFRIGEQRQALAIGDVSGKGTPAAILMAVAYAGFKSLFSDQVAVASVVARLNNFMVEATSTGYYLTFFYGILDREKMVFTYCNAGHNPPMVMRGDRSIEHLSIGGVLLGFVADQTYRQTQLPVSSGDYIVLYTDGVTERMNMEEEEFGEQRLEALLKANYGLRPREMRRRIVTEIKAFAGKKEFDDDFTLVIVYIE